MPGSEDAPSASEPEPPLEAVKPAAADPALPAEDGADCPDGHRRSQVVPLAASPAVSHVSLLELSLEDDGPAAGGDWSAGAAPRVRGLDKLQELERELGAAQQELKLKDEEVAKLNRIRNEIEAEMEELTASLFQVGHVTCPELLLVTRYNTIVGTSQGRLMVQGRVGQPIARRHMMYAVLRTH